jgi:hypothetical protein
MRKARHTRRRRQRPAKREREAATATTMSAGLAPPVSAGAEPDATQPGPLPDYDGPGNGLEDGPDWDHLEPAHLHGHREGLLVGDPAEAGRALYEELNPDSRENPVDAAVAQSTAAAGGGAAPNGDGPYAPPAKKGRRRMNPRERRAAARRELLGVRTGTPAPLTPEIRAALTAKDCEFGASASRPLHPQNCWAWR